jgi:hypothetical protein
VTLRRDTEGAAPATINRELSALTRMFTLGRQAEAWIGQDETAFGLAAAPPSDRHYGLGEGGGMVVEDHGVELRRVAQVGELAVQHAFTIYAARYASGDHTTDRERKKPVADPPPRRNNLSWGTRGLPSPKRRIRWN